MFARERLAEKIGLPEARIQVSDYQVEIIWGKLSHLFVLSSTHVAIKSFNKIPTFN